MRSRGRGGGRYYYCGRAVPSDAQDGVREASLQVREIHGVQALVQDHLTQILQNLINVSIALWISQDGLHICPVTLQAVGGLDHQTRHDN